MKIVLDTNCLLPSIFKSSPYYWLWQAFRNFDFTLCYTTEILNEYEEKMCEYYSESVSKSIIDELLNAVNTQKSAPYYKWNLIHTDPDDNKFVDCALNAGADYIVTNDRHFNVLKTLGFPPVKVIDIETFKKIII